MASLLSTSNSGRSSAPAAASTPGSGVIINGGLSFDASGGGSMFTGGLAGLAASYQSAYNAALSANQQNYNNILSGYQQVAQNQQANQQQIMQGYTKLNNDVLNRLSGSNSSNIQQINDYYTKQLGAAGQSLTDAGLTNSTITQSINRGINMDQAKAVTDSNNKFAQLIAQYQSQLGLAGLGYMDTANKQQTDLGVSQLNWMNSVQVPYPDASAYSQLAQYYGQMDQAEKDRALYEKYLGSLGSGSNNLGGTVSGPRGYTPQPGWGGGATGGNYSLQGTDPGAGYSAYQQQATQTSGTTQAYDAYYNALPQISGGEQSGDGYYYLDTTANYDLEGYY